jgi:hypothetical protein
MYYKTIVLRTTFEIPPSPDKITYSDPVLFIGSCFATSIGNKFQEGRLPVMINPSGTVYNPASVCNTLDDITGGRIYTPDDLQCNSGTWLSFNHSTEFSSADRDEAVNRINKRLMEARGFMSGARFLFVTFGTARIYRWKESGSIVSNCHKIGDSCFTRKLMSVSDIVASWSRMLDSLGVSFPRLKVVFTISPVRHWKDGAHGNQVSKSTLFLAIEELLQHPSGPGYFPAYELLMDDLRDYRFYSDDMLHPSGRAIDYTWDAFTRCYLDEKTAAAWKELSGISAAMSHGVREGKGKELRDFSDKMLSRIDSVASRVPSLNLQKERDYFLGLTRNST